jgi:hypothetical protein
MVIFSNPIEKVMEMFMDNFSIYGKTFKECFSIFKDSRIKC